MAAYYNEIDPDAVAILRELIACDVIAPGDVDSRSIKDVRPDDLRGYTQCHFFAGGGLWSIAARLAGWPDARPLWTGSCPCQPFSPAGKGAGTDDPRHLWPDLHRLIRARRPPVVMGEQVAGKAGYGWLDGVRADLAGEGYASRAVDIPVCAIDGPHQRNRLFWVAVADPDRGGRDGRQEGSIEQPQRGDAAERADIRNARCAAKGVALEHASSDGRQQGVTRPAPARHGHLSSPADGASAVTVEYAQSLGRREGRPEHEFWGGRAAAPLANVSRRADGASAGPMGNPNGAAREERECGDLCGTGRRSEGRATGEPDRPLRARNGSWWAGAEWIDCADGKARRREPGTPMLVDGLPGRVGLWRVAGNAISPILAAEVIAAFMDVEG